MPVAAQAARQRYPDGGRERCGEYSALPAVHGKEKVYGSIP